MRFGETQFPRQAGMRNGGLRCSTGAAIITTDQHYIGVRLGDSGGNSTDADLGHQFDADTCVAIGILKIVNQFGQIFDGINIVMRRR